MPTSASRKGARWGGSRGFARCRGPFSHSRRRSAPPREKRQTRRLGSRSVAPKTTPAPRLLLLDGHSLAYRAFYALPPENFSTQTGQVTNAVFGFTSMLINMIKDE